MTERNTPQTTLRHWLFLVVVAGLAIAVDQATKAYVTTHLDRYESWMPVDFIRPVFKFTHVHNTGAAFGMFPQGSMVFLAVAITIVGVILYYYRDLPFGGWLVRFALSLQVAGALGNVIDRVRLGYVVDFFNVVYWPVFNVADSCVVVGVVLLGLAMLREEWRTAKQREQAESTGENGASGSSEKQAIG